jgi:hypothetical protein
MSQMVLKPQWQKGGQSKMKALRRSLRWILPSMVSMVMLGLLMLGLQSTVQSTAHSSGSSGRFGVALGNWNTAAVTYYDTFGEEISPTLEPRMHTLTDTNEMRMKSYRSPTYGFAHPYFNGNSCCDAFNVATSYYLDAEANTIFVLYHFLAPYSGIPLQSNAPGQIRAYRTEYGVNPSESNGSYIWQRDKFKQWLIAHRNFDDGWGNWYSFYLLSEVDSTLWTKLTATEYVAVIKDYVEFLDEVKSAIKSQHDKDVTPRIILSSPMLGSSIRYDRSEGHVKGSSYLNEERRQYYTNVWEGLTSHEQDMVAYTSIDIFFGPPPGPDCNADNPVPGCHYYGTEPVVQEGELEIIASEVLSVVQDAGQFFYTLTDGRETLITQFGPRLPGSGWGAPDYSWASADDDKWRTTEWGNARLTQMVLQRLVLNVNQTHVIAWAYWGSIVQPLWTEPFSEKQWGGTKHGVMWLAWDLLMTPENVAKYCPSCAVTNEVWPTRTGIVYLHAANGDLNYRDPEAPSWWH